MVRDEYTEQNYTHFHFVFLCTLCTGLYQQTIAQRTAQISHTNTCVPPAADRTPPSFALIAVLFAL